METHLVNTYEEDLVNRMNRSDISNTEQIEILIELTTFQAMEIDALERKVAQLESKTYLTLD